MSDLNASFEAGEADAIAQGLTVLTAQPNQLFIDLDSDDAWLVFQQRFAFCQRHEENGSPALHVSAQWWSRSGRPHRHIVLESRCTWTVEQQIMWQALLGSDPIKEYLTLLRYYAGIMRPIRLFQPPNPHDTDWYSREDEFLF